MNDRQKYQFAGEPERCIVCGEKLKHTISHPVFRGAVLIKHQVICPQYGHTSGPVPSLHECYIFFEDDPGLAPFLSYSVGNAGPTTRAVLYTTVVFLMLLAFMLLAARVLG